MADKSISNFMTTQKLFKPTNYPFNQRMQLFNNSTNTKPSSKSYHYHLRAPTDRVKQDIDGGEGKAVEEREERGGREGRDNSQGGKRVEGYNRVRQLVSGGRQPGKIEQHSRNSPGQQSSRSPKPPKPHPLNPDSPTLQQQSPTTWQTIVIKSSRKYFDSCRSQALQYLYKLTSILESDKSYLTHSISKINTYIRNQHEELGEAMKMHMYAFIDEALENWKQQSLSHIESNKIYYLSELLELNTQVEERYKQIEGYKIEIEEEKEWRNRVGELLKESYEEDLVLLSQMCRKAVGKVEADVKKYWDGVGKGVEEGIGDKGKRDSIVYKLGNIISQQCINISKQQKPSKVPQPQLQPQQSQPRQHRQSQPREPQAPQLSRDLKAQYTRTSQFNPSNQPQEPTYTYETAQPPTQARDKYGDYINRVYNKQDEARPATGGGKDKGDYQDNRYRGV